MHDVKALVAQVSALREAAKGLASAVVCALPQGYGLIPITDRLACELAGKFENTPGLVPDMAPGVSGLAVEAAKHSPVVYTSTEYFGGTGGQDALLWEQGELRAKFLSSEIGDVWPNSPISQALRAIGVKADAKEDEFDALGLGNHRCTEGWASAHAPV
jgi:hypothetical protein